MPTYVVEVTYMLPVYKHVVVEANSSGEACESALECDNWDDGEFDFDSAGPSTVTGIWLGQRPYTGDSIPIPDRFAEK